MHKAFLFFRTASFPASLRQKYTASSVSSSSHETLEAQPAARLVCPAFACPVEHAARARPGDDQRMLLIRMLCAEASSSAEISFAAALRIEELLRSGLGPWGGGVSCAVAPPPLPQVLQGGASQMPLSLDLPHHLLEDFPWPLP